MQIRDQLRELINDPLLTKIALILSEPNLFYVLRLQRHEIRHSNFLAWLLDPNASHGLGDKFLRMFLKDVAVRASLNEFDEFQMDACPLEETVVLREWKNIDILIRTSSFVICIENKVDAKEYSNQLSRYRQTVSSAYPDTPAAHVFLTPDEVMPSDPDDVEAFVTYGYARICEHLEVIIRLFSTAMSRKVEGYIAEYSELLRREVMQNDEASDLARQIYQTHRQALDFILEHRPDRLREVGPMLESMIRESGWVLCSSSKGQIRFLTQSLVKSLPKTGNSKGWKGRESFLFEFDLYSGRIVFKTTISPGDESVRSQLRGVLDKLEDARKKLGKEWVTHFILSWTFDVTDESEDLDKVQKMFESIWPEVKTLVSTVDSALSGLRFT